MPGILGLGADLPEDALLPWQKTADQKRQSMLAFRDKIKKQPYLNQIGYDTYRQQEQGIVDQSNANLRASQTAAAGKKAREAADRDRWAKEEQAKAQKDLQERYAEYVRTHPYQNQGNLTSGPGPGGQNFAGGSSAQQYNGQDTELAQLARAAGFPEDQIPMAVAVALAESGGSATATHSNSNGSVDNGLWQINSVHSGMPGYSNVMDPLQNARLAFQIYKDAGNSWSPWVTAQNGLQQQFMSRGQAAAQSVAGQQAWMTHPSQTVNSGATTGVRNTIVTTTLSALGTPYAWGGESLKNGVDCSGLVMEAYAAVGISLPHSANLQSDAYGGDTNIYGRRVPLAQLQPGDLVAWDHNRSGERSDFVGHIAVYIGNGQIVEAYTSGMPVRQRALRTNEEHIYGVHMTLPGDK